MNFGSAKVGTDEPSRSLIYVERVLGEESNAALKFCRTVSRWIPDKRTDIHLLTTFPLKPPSRKTRQLFAFAILGVFAFAAGGLAFKFKPFPYGLIVKGASGLRKVIARRALVPADEIARQYSRLQVPNDATARAIDTALLPFISRSLTVATGELFPVGGGTLVVIDDKPVIIDWMGAVYLVQLPGGPLTLREFPLLPNGREAFLQSLIAPLTPTSLKVHHAQYVPATRMLVVAHESFDSTEQRPQMAVSSITIDPVTIKATGDWRTVYRSEVMKAERYSSSAGGGRLAVRTAGKILLTIGDYNQDGVFSPPPTVAQNPASSFGKIVEIDLASGAHQLISIGHRNPQGLVVTRNGEIYSTEHGPHGGDELNHIVPGADFGWPKVTLGTDYGTYDWPGAQDSSRHSNYTLPTFAWVPSIGVSNLIEIQGMGERWDGDLLVASLKARTLFRLRMDSGRVVYSEPIWVGKRIRDIAQLRSGAILLWTDEAELITLQSDIEKLNGNQRGLGYFGQSELASCMTCHHFELTSPLHLAPTLANLIGREVGHDSYGRYTPGMKALGGSWTGERLTAFLANPSSLVPGTSMPKPNLTPAQIAGVVAILVNAKSGGGSGTH